MCVVVLLLVRCAKRDALSSDRSTSDGNREPPSVGKAIVSFLKERGNGKLAFAMIAGIVRSVYRQLMHLKAGDHHASSHL